MIWSSQLTANDFPPVCAMTGAPAETWRKFRFSTAPVWTYWLLLFVCVGLIGIIVYSIVVSAVSQRAAGFLPLTRASSQKVSLANWVPTGLIIGSFVVGITAALVGASSSSSSSHTNSALLYTTWVADAKVTNGPEPGYKPALTSLTGNDINSVTAAIDPNGTSWVLNVAFTSHGADQFAALTRANVAACPGDVSTDPKAECPQRHLAMWLGLTQEDIDGWDDPTTVANVSKPWDSGGRFITDPITLQEIDGGNATISGSFTQKQAEDLAAAIQVRTTTSSPVTSAIAWGLVALALLAFVVGLAGALVLRRLIGPRASVSKQQPGQYDRLVELRGVHPSFVAAVSQVHRERAAQYASMQQAAQVPLPPGST